MESKTESLPLRAELINHLSKEIEVLSTNVVTTRLKAAFTVWIGPYLLLGAVLIRQQQNHPIALDYSVLLAVGIIFVLYLALAYAAGRIEHYVSAKCNEWRDLIAALSFESELNIERARQLLRDKYLEDKVQKAYMTIWLLMSLAFASILYLVWHLLTEKMSVPSSIFG